MKFFLFLLLALPPFCLEAQTSALSSGLWSNPATWGGGIPTGETDVTIPAGVTVTIDGTQECGSVTVNGTLTVVRAAAFLTCDSIMVMGSSATFSIGTPSNRHSDPFTLTLKGLPSEATGAMGTKFIGAMNGGHLEFHGEERVSWTRLGASAAAGSSTIALQEPVDWRVGDEILITSTTFDWNQAEQRTITAVSGDQRTVTLNAALTHFHSGVTQTHTRPHDGKSWTIELRAEVGLLSRRIRIQGDAASETAGLGGHMMVMNTGVSGTAHIQGVELYRMGQKAILGRYPMHWHMVKNAGVGQYFRNSSVHRSFNRAITIHGTESTLVEDNFCYDHIGHGLFLEDGSERFNQIRGNVVLLTKRPAPGEQLTPSDNELNQVQNRTPASFWITNPNNIFEDNVAAGTQGTGYWFAMPTAPMGLSGQDPYFSGLQPHTQPLGGFNRNVAHSCMSGFDINDQLTPDHSIRPNGFWANNGPHSMRDCVWYSNDVAIYVGGALQYRDTVTYYNNTFADNRNALFFASFHTVEESLIIANSGSGNMSPATRPIMYTIYDGAGRMRNNHGIGWHDDNATLLENVGSAVKHPNHRFEGFTWDQPGPPSNLHQNFNVIPPRRDLYAYYIPHRPSVWTQVIHDVDGSTTGRANSSIVINNPFMLAGGEYKPANWENSYISPYRFAHVQATYGNIPEAQNPNVSIVRTRPDTQSEGVFFISGFNERQHLPMIVNQDFLYTYYYETIPPNKHINFSLDDAEIGDKILLRLKNFGRVTSLTTNNLPEYGSYASLISSPISGYYRESNGDLSIRLVAANKYNNNHSLSWGGNSVNLTEAWDSDGDGVRNSAEADAGTDPFEFAAPPIVAVNTEFNSNGNFEGWTISNDISSQNVTNGAYNANSIGNDPYLSRENLDFEGYKASTIRIRLRQPTNDFVRLFWGTRENPFDSDLRVVSAIYSGGGDWQELIFDMSSHPEWGGHFITKLRLDPRGSQGNFSVDYIRVLDTDGDGFYDHLEGTLDNDGDGTPNFLDIDSDDDSIFDRIEGDGDPDRDGLVNYLDPDSDGDGVSDQTEGVGDPDHDNVPNYLDLNSDGDGLLDCEEGSGDPDNDGIPNFLDLDSDNDGIIDTIEGTDDPDQDGLANYLDFDSDGDGILDAEEGTGDPDHDNLPNYLDLDSDDDGATDREEGTGDADNDGIPNFLDPDSVVDLLAPLATDFSPANGSINVAADTNLSLTFDEEMVAAGGNITLRNLETDTQTLIAVTDTTQVSISGFTVTINPGSNLVDGRLFAVQIEPGALTDLAGNSYAGISDESTWVFRTIDVSPPSVISLDPANGSEEVDVTHNLVAVFSEPILPGSIGTITLTNLLDNSQIVIGVGDTSQVDITGSTLTIDPTHDLTRGRDYSVRIDLGIVVDRAGHPFAGINDDLTWTFATRDQVAPVITTLEPANGFLKVDPTTNLSVHFDEEIALGTGNVILSNLDTGAESVIAVTDSTQVSIISMRTLTINPSNDLAPDTRYSVIIASGAVTDLSSNPHAGITQETIWTFRTHKLDGPRITSLFPAHRAVDIAPPASLIVTFDRELLLGTGFITISNLSSSTQQIIYILDSTQVTISGQTITITPTQALEQGADYEILIPAGIVTDVYGIPLLEDNDGMPWSLTFTHLLLNNLSPSSGSTDIAPNQSFYAYFDHPIAIGTGSVYFHNFDDDSKNFSIDSNDSSRISFFESLLIINPGPSLEDHATYAITFDPGVVVKQSNGGPFTGLTDLTDWTFTMEGPNLTLDPVSGSTGIERNRSFLVTYDDPIAIGSGQVHFHHHTDGSQNLSFDISNPSKVFVFGDILYIDPGVALEPGATYSITIDSGAVQMLSTGTSHPGIQSLATWEFTITNLFTDWIADFPVGSENEFSHDPDGDGLSNGIENILGTDPTEATYNIVSKLRFDSPSTFHFVHNLNASPASDLELVYLWTTDLQTYHESGQSDGQTTVTFSAPQLETPEDGRAIIDGVIPRSFFFVLAVRQIP